MCLALPARVVELVGNDQAVIELGGIRKTISLALVDGIAPGDYVIVHVGYALTRLDPAQAEATLALMAASTTVAAAP
ncbi:HypC/HybG/HupF family hydrogenase formation chaperone [Metallibacterium sp.]|uniref:HypC/HybG/HupF family hydrogenase formation chaperone n=1 Tax=Metallibacterium sp. TaxID=2940281 RepID=UPI002626B45F|nr:HypC/HybG/HupF family hydrogenase formation chaperone [Metallibacterium sp.]